MKIAVGSVSEQKLGYVEKILQEIGLAAELFPVAVPSGVPEQPLTGEATETGAKNRAQGALEHTPEADFGLGIEVGYHQNERDNFEIFCCAAVCDHGGFAETCFSSRFLLPEFHQEVLKEGKSLGEFVNDYKKGVDEPVTNYTRELVRGRRPLIIEAVRGILLRYLGKGEYR